jgi:hypothetical protein
MVKWLMRRGLAAFERQWNYDATYVHEMIEPDPRAAVRREDCGPCTQVGVSMAERAGVDPKVLRAVLTETPVMMPPGVAS